MKNILKFFGVKVKKEPGTKSPVYVFFAEADSGVKTEAYRKALRGASEEQKSVISRYDKQFAQTN